MEIIINRKDQEAPYVVSGKILQTKTGQNELLTGGPPVATTGYWIAPTTANWSDSANWSLTSGGSGGATVPGVDGTAIFDTSGAGSCVFDTPVSVQTGTLNLSGYHGTFFGSCITKELHLNSGYITAGNADSTIQVSGNVYGSSSYGMFHPNNSMPILLSSKIITGSDLVPIASQAVTPDGTGMLSTLVSFNNNLYSTDGLGNLWRRDGASLTKMADGTFISTINTLIEYNGSLFLGAWNGSLQQWDGVNSWIQVASASPNVSSIRGITTLDGELYASGTNNAGNIPDLLKWDGVSSWVTVSGDATAGDSWISVLGTYNGGIYALTGDSTVLLYKWDGIGAWEFVAGSPTNNRASCMLQFGSNLFIGTLFQGCLWKWDGMTLSEIATYNPDPGANDINQLIEYQGHLYGVYGTGSPSTVGKLLKWDGATSWTPVSEDVSYSLTGLAILNDQLYCASAGN